MELLATGAGRLAAYVGCYTLMNEQFRQMGDQLLDWIKASRDEDIRPESINSVRRSGLLLPPKISMGLSYIGYFSQSLICHQIFFGILEGKGSMGYYIRQCYSPKVAIVASLCFALYAGVKRYSLDRTRPWSYVANIAEVIGKGALIGVISHYSPVLGLVSFYPLHLVDYSRRGKVRDDRAINTVIGPQGKTVEFYLKQITDRINYTFSQNVEEGDEQDVQVLDTIPFGSVNLLKANFEALKPMSEGKVKTTITTNDEMNNLAFLNTGLTLLDKRTQPEGSTRNNYWLTRFAQLLNDPSTSIQARRQLAIDYYRSDW